jgi:hypothetical protein
MVIMGNEERRTKNEERNEARRTKNGNEERNNEQNNERNNEPRNLGIPEPGKLVKRPTEEEIVITWRGEASLADAEGDLGPVAGFVDADVEQELARRHLKRAGLDGEFARRLSILRGERWDILAKRAPDLVGVGKQPVDVARLDSRGLGNGFTLQPSEVAGFDQKNVVHERGDRGEAPIGLQPEIERGRMRAKPVAPLATFFIRVCQEFVQCEREHLILESSL